MRSPLSTLALSLALATPVAVAASPLRLVQLPEEPLRLGEYLEEVVSSSRRIRAFPLEVEDLLEAGDRRALEEAFRRFVADGERLLGAGFHLLYQDPAVSPPPLEEVFLNLGGLRAFQAVARGILRPGAGDLCVAERAQLRGASEAMTRYLSRAVDELLVALARLEDPPEEAAPPGA